MILAGDVGGTKALLGLFRRVDGRLRCEYEVSLPSREFRSFHQAFAPSAAVARAGLRGDDVVAERALDLFLSLYGAAAGDLALAAGATGGVYVCGGIARKILPKLRSGAFLRAFRDKGRLSRLMGRIPVRVILEQRAGLLGAARYAATMKATG